MQVPKLITAAVLFVVLCLAFYLLGHMEGQRAELPDRTGKENHVAPQPSEDLPTVAPPPEVATPLASNGPKIEFELMVFDFGKVMAGEAIPYVFNFTNAGGEVLEISKIETTCGCTVMGDFDKSVPPGGTGEIPIVLETEKFDTELEKFITVHCNDSEQPTVTLAVKGIVWQPIEVSPRDANLGVVNLPDSPKPVTVSLMNRLEKALEIRTVKSSGPEFSAELKTIEPGKAFELTVQAVPPFKYGGVGGDIAMETNFEEKPVLSVGAFYYVTEPVEVSPKALTIPPGPLPQPLERFVTVACSDRKNFAISEVLMDAKGVEVNVEQTVLGQRWKIHVLFPEGFQAPADRALMLTFKTNHSYAPQVKVPFRSYKLPPVQGGKK